MTRDRWRQIEELCHAALARPVEEQAAFLTDACAGDQLLQTEIESLLAHATRADRFMNEPAAAVAAIALSRVSVDPDQMSGQSAGTLAGQRFGAYTIGSLLGVGGMGEVYRAHDSTLGRDVAVKVLPPAFSDDPQRRARFEREARVLATVNHPNIGSIYGLEDFGGGVQALILELVEGQTLAERIGTESRPPSAAPPGLPVREVRFLARQIASALDAAHEKGIVHRDLKPANIKITPDGVVKVLDFGLAKAASPDLGGPGVAESRDGIILGTAAYMSPEQARGNSVDKRGDIWAFGCVVYEMLTGQIAFAGATASDTIAKILEREPDWSALPVSTPPSLRHLLLRCLAKDPKQRLRDIGDIDTDEDPVAADESRADAAATTQARARTSLSVLPWLAIGALAGGVIAWGVRRPVIADDTPLVNAHFSRFTVWDGMESGAEISPDGKFVAFIADRNQRLDLWVSQVGTGRFVNLTRDLPPLSAPGAILRTFGFSGDGAEVWFAEAGDAASRKWLVPLTGGTPRAFLSLGAAAPSWSPDDSQLAYFMNGNGDPLFLADRTGADARPIVVSPPGFFAKGIHNHNPRWSQDGQWLYFAHGPEPVDEMNIWRVHPGGGAPEQLTQLRTAANFLTPIDARTLLYIARADDGSGPWLWSLDVATRVSRRVISGTEHYSSVSASLDGRRVVATAANPTTDLWRVPLLDRLAEDGDVTPYALPTSRPFAPRFGGSSLFYLSGEGTGDNLWRFEDGNATNVWKGVNESLSEPPVVSPDGTRVAVVVRRNGSFRLMVMLADGTNQQTLAPSIAIQSSGGQGSADWSPDGTWIVTAGIDAKGAGVFKVPVNGGAPVRLTSGPAVNPVWSPNGTLIVYGGAVVGGQVPLLGVKPDGTPVDLPPLRIRLGGGHRFLPDGTGLVYLPRGQSLDFSLLDLSTKQSRVLTRLTDHGTLNRFDIAPDAKEIVFDRSRENSDIALIELPKR